MPWANKHLVCVWPECNRTLISIIVRTVFTQLVLLPNGCWGKKKLNKKTTTNVYCSESGLGMTCPTLPLIGWLSKVMIVIIRISQVGRVNCEESTFYCCLCISRNGKHNLSQYACVSHFQLQPWLFFPFAFYPGLQHLSVIVILWNWQHVCV